MEFTNLHKWPEIEKYFEERFGQDLDFKGILFLIGVQELGKGFVKLTKDQKVDVIHIAICKLLSRYGYYEYVGLDEDGWPHYRVNKSIPELKPGEQLKTLKSSIIQYIQEDKRI